MKEGINVDEKGVDQKYDPVCKSFLKKYPKVKTYFGVFFKK